MKKTENNKNLYENLDELRCLLPQQFKLYFWEYITIICKNLCSFQKTKFYWGIKDYKNYM